MFKIGEFSKITNVTVKALRHYEKIGLLIPAKVEEENGYRYYHVSQLKRINQIRLLQQIGLSLEVIKNIIEQEDFTVLNHYYEMREKEIQQELDQLKNKKNMVEELKKQLKEGSSMDKYNVIIKTIPARKVMSIRKIMPNYDSEGQLWSELYDECQKQQIQLSQPPLGISIYHDSDYKEADVDVEIQSRIVGDYQDTETVKFFEAEEMVIASVTFSGSFEQMPQVTQALGTWIEANGYKINGPMINISHVSPMQDPNPDNWITEAGFAVAKR